MADGGPRDGDGLEALETQRHGRYVATGALGQGAMGEVLLAWDPELRRELALKVLREREGDPDDRARARFLHEARIGGRLDHPGIVPVFDLGADEQGRPFFTMRRVTGRTLEEILGLRREGDPEQTLVRVLSVLLKVCHAVAYAHDHGVVHRDLKPANVMIGDYGEVYVMDWGLAHRLDARDEEPASDVPDAPPRASGDEAPHESPLLTREGDVIGTPAYMAPEQALGKVGELGPPTDVYAVGAILYQLATGTLPYTAPGERVSASDVMRRVRQGPPVPARALAPDVPPELLAICEKAMARSPSDRYADMGGLARDLEAFLEGRVVSAYRTGALAEVGKWIARNRLLATTVALSLLVLVVGSLVANAVLAGANDELEQARDLAMQRQGEAERALLSETAARAEAEAAVHREESARVAAEAAAQREALVRREAVAAAEREAAARADARWQTYRATLSAASANLALGDFGNARERLDLADDELAGWERDVLELRADPSLARYDAGAAAHVRALALSPDGRIVASGGSAGSLALRELASGALVAEPPLPGYVRDLCFTPDGRRLVVAEGEEMLTQRDASSGFLLMRLRGHQGVVTAVACRPDGRVLASASEDRTVRVWDSSTGETLAVLAHDAPVDAVAFDPQGHLLASAGDDGVVQLYDAQSFLHVGVLAEHSGRVEALAFDRAGERLLSAGADGVARVWDVYGGRPVARVGAETEILDAALSADGTRALLGASDGALLLADARDGTLLARIEGHLAAVQAVAFADDARLLVSGAADGTLRVWDAATRTGPQRLPGHDDVATCVAASPDGARLASGGFDRSVRVLDAASGDLLAVLRGHESGVASLAFGRDGRLLVSGDDRGGVLLFDVERGALVERLEEPAGRVAHVAARADGSLVAVARGGRGNRAYQDGRLLRPLPGEREIVLRDGGSGARVATLPGQAYGTTATAFSGDGRLLVSGSQGGGLAVWDVASGGLLRELASEPSDGRDPGLPPVAGVAVDATGRTIVSAHLSRLLSIVLWDGETGARRAVLRGHDTRVWSVALHPDGRRLLSTGEDGTLRAWDTRSGDALLTLAEPGLSGLWVTFANDGRRALSTARDGTLVAWDSDVRDARALWQGSERRARAAGLVTALLDEQAVPERALAALAARGDLEPALAESTRRLLAQAATPTTTELNRAAWDVVRVPDRGDDEYAWALLRSELARARAPDAPGVLNTHGVSLYRVGRWDEALAELERADALNVAAGVRYPRAGDRLVMAMCLVRLEREDEAHALLREALGELDGETDADILALADEARALLGEAR